MSTKKRKPTTNSELEGNKTDSAKWINAFTANTPFDDDPCAYKPNRHVPELSQQDLRRIWSLLEMDNDPMPGASETEWLFASPPSIEEYGQLATLPETQILHWLVLFQERAYAPKEIKLKFFDLMADKFMERDIGFFERLATLMKMLRDKFRFVDVKLRDLGIKQGAGRKMQPYDLSIAFPMAVDQLFAYRVFEIPPDRTNHRTHRITREELKKEITRIQTHLGSANAAEINDKELSRHIAKSPVREFME